MKTFTESLVIMVAVAWSQSQAATKVEWDAVFADPETYITDVALDGQGAYWLTGGKVLARIGVDGAMLWKKPAAPDSLVFAGPYQSGMAVLQQTPRDDYLFDRKLLLLDGSGAIVATRTLEKGPRFEPRSSTGSWKYHQRTWNWGQWHADGSLVMIHRDTVAPYAMSANSYSVGSLKSWSVPLGNDSDGLPTFVQNAGKDGAWILQFNWPGGQQVTVQARWISADGLPGPEQDFTVDGSGAQAGSAFFNFIGAIPLGNRRLAIAYSIDEYRLSGNPPEELHVRIMEGNGGPSSTGEMTLQSGSNADVFRERDSSLEVVYSSTSGGFESSLFFDRATGAFRNESPRRWFSTFTGQASDFGTPISARDVNENWLAVGMIKRILERPGEPESIIAYPVILSGGTNQGATTTPQWFEAYPDTMCAQCLGLPGFSETVGFLATADGGGLLYGHYRKAGQNNVSVGAIKVSPGFELPVRPRPLVRGARTLGTSQVDLLGRVLAPDRLSHGAWLRKH